MAEFYATPFWFQASVFTALGLCVGSFLNVVIWRLPVMMQREFEGWAREALATAESNDTTAEATETDAAPEERFDLVKPDSHCPKCRAPIRAWQNIPVLSWLILRGRCASCRAPISIRYPLVELATGVLSLLVAIQFGTDNPAAWFALPCVWTLLALTMIDFDHQLLPDTMTFPLIFGGLLLSVWGIYVDPATAILGACAGYLSLWSVYWAFKLLTGREGMGYGDFKLLSAAGAWLGWMALPYLVLIASILGLVIQGTLMAVSGSSESRPFAFGPYLALGFVILLLFREEISRYAAVPL